MLDRHELKQNARDLMHSTTPSPLLVGLVLFVFSWFISFLVSRITGEGVVVNYSAFMSGDAKAMAQAVTFHPENVGVLGRVLCVALELVSTLLTAGFVLYTLRVTRRQSASVATLFDIFAHSLRVIALEIVMGVLIGLATVLLIVPGLILTYAYRMALFLLLDHPDWGIFRCLGESRRMMRGHKWELFVLDLSFLGWTLLCVFPPVTIYVTPYRTLTMAEYYNRLAGISAPQQTQYNDNPGEKPPWEY